MPGAGGTGIINSNAIFDETVTVTESLTIHGGVGFRPTIRATASCGVVRTCALNRVSVQSGSIVSQV